MESKEVEACMYVCMYGDQLVYFACSQSVSWEVILSALKSGKSWAPGISCLLYRQVFEYYFPLLCYFRDVNLFGKRGFSWGIGLELPIILGRRRAGCLYQKTQILQQLNDKHFPHTFCHRGVEKSHL